MNCNSLLILLPLQQYCHQAAPALAKKKGKSSSWRQLECQAYGSHGETHRSPRQLSMGKHQKRVPSATWGALWYQEVPAQRVLCKTSKMAISNMLVDAVLIVHTQNWCGRLKELQHWMRTKDTHAHEIPLLHLSSFLPKQVHTWKLRRSPGPSSSISGPSSCMASSTITSMLSQQEASLG